MKNKNNSETGSTDGRLWLATRPPIPNTLEVSHGKRLHGCGWNRFRDIKPAAFLAFQFFTLTIQISEENQ